MIKRDVADSRDVRRPDFVGQILYAQRFDAEVVRRISRVFPHPISISGLNFRTAFPQNINGLPDIPRQFM